jgi:hypothetical protein
MSEPDLEALQGADSDGELPGREYLVARAIIAALDGRPLPWLEKRSGFRKDGTARIDRQNAWQLTKKPRRGKPDDDTITGLATAFGWSEDWTRNLFSVAIGLQPANTLQFAGLLDPVVDQLPIERQMEWAKLLNEAAADYAAAHPEA